jgi:hypothetical protein
MSKEGGIVYPPELQQLKAATKALIRAFGGQEAAEAATGRSQSQLSNYGGPNAPGFAPIDVVLALEAATHGAPGHPHVTRFLAANAGYLLVAKPEALPANADWCAALGDAVAEFSDVHERVLRALPGGVTAAELRKADIRHEIAEAMTRLAMLDVLAARAMEGE